MKSRTFDVITVTDLFCGAGGSTLGAELIDGVRVRMAANHARHAIDTHQHNHPHTDHDCADISQVVPAKYPRTDILWASPECTHHTRARGKKRCYGEFNDGLFATDGTDEAAMRSRATMHDVARFAEHHRYRVIIVENVPDARWWGPADAPGFAFDTWVRSVALWGPYLYRIVYLDSAHAQAAGPGSRSRRPRMYVVFWRQGDRAPDFDKWLRPYGICPAHGRVHLMQSFKRTRVCSPERPWGVYGVKTGQYLYRCPHVTCRNQVVEPPVRGAIEALDLTLPAQMLGERPRPLAPNTMRKISAGWDRYQLHGGGSTHRRASEPMSTLTAGGINHGVVYADPASHELLPYYGNSTAQPVTQPMPTLTTHDRHGLIGYATSLEECRYRMIRAREAARAMEFPDTFVFLGRREQQVEMIGNAVTSNAGRDLVGMAVEALTGQDAVAGAAAPHGQPVQEAA
ncbi:DNA cytosine methyltransferase [Streptomyces noboritoensis]|uniref:DNA (cytosine-5-)-methyltransferase n=1 Tax=Streptomyces noboritoensis TaxID=67337 RepID=A0ABV6TCD0_9ACTN